MSERRVETTLYSLSPAPPAPAERRSSERILSLLRVGTLTLGERRELCLIRNISAGGMMIRAYSEVACGTRLSIELKQGEPIAGVACWAGDGLTGVTFDKPIDVVALLSSTARGPRARLPRVEVNCSAWVREGAIVQRARVLNISQGGIRVEAKKPLTPHAEAVVTLIGFPPVAAVTKWKEGDCYGIGFNRKLPFADLIAWLGEQQDGRRASA